MELDIKVTDLLLHNKFVGFGLCLQAHEDTNRKENLLSHTPLLAMFCGATSTNMLGKTVKVVANVSRLTMPVHRTSHIACQSPTNIFLSLSPNESSSIDGEEAR